MLSFLVPRPIAVLLSFAGAAVLGLILLRQLPVSLLPEVDVPRIAVQIGYPNTDAGALENSVVSPMRNQLLQIGGLADIGSETRNESATITLDFNHGTNTNLAFIEVNEKIDLALSRLPRDLERPRVVQAGVSDIPVFYLSVAPKPAYEGDPLALAELTQSVIKRRIEQLPQVAFADRSGFAEPEITVKLNPEAIQNLSLDPQDLHRIIAENNLELGSLLVQEGHYQYNIRLQSGLRSADDVAAIYFRHQGRVLQLKDIAEVRMQEKKRQGLYLTDGRQGIVFTIRKQADAQLFDLQEAFGILLVSMQQDYPQLDFTVTNDQSEILRVSIDNLLSSLGYGALFAFLILFFFFRGWRAPVYIGLVVPVSLSLSFFGFYLFDLSINTISLSGLILGVGLMIDNSIIVIESILQKRYDGMSLLESCVEGAKEVFSPLLSSTLTSCAVFLPLIFLSGITGALFYDYAVAVTIALGLSLFVSYLLLPTLIHLLEQKSSIASKDLKINWKGYRNSVHWALKWPLLTLLIFFAFTIWGRLPMQSMRQEAFPPITRAGLEIDIDWASPIDLAENEKRVLHLLTSFDSLLEHSNVFLGTSQFLLESEKKAVNEAKLLVFNKPGIKIEVIETQLEHFLTEFYPSAKIAKTPLKNIFDVVFGNDDAPLIVYVQQVDKSATPTPDQLNPLKQYLQSKGKEVTLPATQEQILLSILPEAALLHEVPLEAIHVTLQTLFNDYETTTIRTSNQHIPVVIAQGDTSFYERLNTAMILNRQSRPISVKNLVSVSRKEYYKTITSNRIGEAAILELDTFDEATVNQVRHFISSTKNLKAGFAGQYFNNQKLLKEAIGVALVSLLLLYLILAAQFESLIQPLIVMLTVPVGISGSLLLLWWYDQSFNLISVIGIVVMSGIVVNDAILKIDMINRRVKGTGVIEAIHQAGERRLRAIVMTTLTEVLAVLPVIFSSGLGAELQQPLTYALIGGLSIGTLSSLYFIPALYLVFRKIGTYFVPTS